MRLRRFVSCDEFIGLEFSGFTGKRRTHGDDPDFQGFLARRRFAPESVAIGRRGVDSRQSQPYTDSPLLVIPRPRFADLA